ncbi:MAG: hypothetical protein ABIQ40_16310 [Bacteroidia bacterium]
MNSKLFTFLLIMISSVLFSQTAKQDYFYQQGRVRSRAFYDVGKAKWSIYMKLQKFDSNSYVFMKAEELDGLILIVQKEQEGISK